MQAYLAWRPDPFSNGTDAFQLSCRNLKGYIFPPFYLIGQVLGKVQIQNSTIILRTPAWQAQPWYPKGRHISIHNPVLILKENNLLIGPDSQPHQLVT